MNDRMDQAISFVREKNGDKVLVFMNLSKDHALVQFDTSFDISVYTNLFTGKLQSVNGTLILDMQPWEYLILYHTSS